MGDEIRGTDNKKTRTPFDRHYSKKPEMVRRNTFKSKLFFFHFCEIKLVFQKTRQGLGLRYERREQKVENIVIAKKETEPVLSSKRRSDS